MMRILSLAAGVICGIAPAAHAFDTGECSAIEEQISTLLDAEFGWEVTQSPVSQAVAFERGCLVTALDVYVQDLGVTYRVAEAALVGEGLMEWVRGDVVLPASVSLQLDGVALMPGADVPTDVAWLTDVAAETIYLDARWDGAGRTLRIAPLRIDLGDGNDISLAVEGQALAWQPYAMSAEDFAFQSVSLDMAFNGMFEQAIAPPIEANGNDLSPESAQFLSAMAFGLLANVPETLVSGQSRDAVAAFLATIPTPRGDLSLSLANDAPFFPGEVESAVLNGASLLEALPDQLTLEADWWPEN